MVFGAIKDALFGTDPEVQPRSTLTAEQRRLLDEFLIPYLRGTPIDQVGDQYSGDFVAGLGEQEQALLSQLVGNAQGGGTVDQTTLQGLVQQLASGASAGTTRDVPDQATGVNDLLSQITSNPQLAQFIQANPTDFQEYFRTNVEQPALENFREQILPALSREFAGQSFGSQRKDVTLQATDDLTKNLTAARAKTAFDTRESAMQRALEALGLGGQLAGQQAQIGESGRQANLQSNQQVLDRLLSGQRTALEGIGLQGQVDAQQQANLREALTAAAIPREIEDRQLAAEYSDFIRRIGQKDTRIQQILGALGTPSTENIGFQGEPGAAGGILEAALGAAGAAGGFGALFSSRDLKEDIKPVTHEELGKAIKETKLKSFKYKPEMKAPSDHYVGMIAEEAPDIFKNRDGKSINGYNVLSALLSNAQETDRRLMAIEQLKRSW